MRENNEACQKLGEGPDGESSSILHPDLPLIFSGRLSATEMKRSVIEVQDSMRKERGGLRSSILEKTHIVRRFKIVTK